MKIEIKTTKANTAYNSHAFCADIKVNGKWFKQITSSETDKNKFELECLQITIDDLKQDSHSPTEPDVLLEGDWVLFNREGYKQFDEVKSYKPGILTFYHETLPNEMFKLSYGSMKKTKLTPEEFLRRAENTFKTK